MRGKFYVLLKFMMKNFVNSKVLNCLLISKGYIDVNTLEMF